MPGRSNDGSIHVHVIVPLTPDAGLAGLQPLYEQFALVVEDLQIKVDRRDRDREQIACTGMPEVTGTPAARPGRDRHGPRRGGSVPGAARGQSPVTTN